MNSLASPSKDANALDPFANLRIGHFYLDARTRRLHCLNETAREFRKEGIILTSGELVQQRLRTLAGGPVEAADLPLMIAWQQGRPAEASFVLHQEGKPDWHIFWSASPVRDADGRV